METTIFAASLSSAIEYATVNNYSYHKGAADCAHGESPALYLDENPDGVSAIVICEGCYRISDERVRSFRAPLYKEDVKRYLSDKGCEALSGMVDDVIDRIKIKGGGEMILVDLYEIGITPILSYPDGVALVPEDLHSWMPLTEEDINEVEWVAIEEANETIEF